MKSSLAESHRRLGGIYAITNTANGRIYIGSTHRFHSRLSGHTRGLLKQRHENRFLQADFLKCGAECFRFDVVEVVDGSLDERLRREEEYLSVVFDKGICCYNLTDSAVTREGRAEKSGKRKHAKRGPLTEATKRKISEANSGTRNGMHGRRRASYEVSAETRRKISEVQRGVVRGPMPEEHRRKIGDAQRGEKNHRYGKEPWNKGGAFSDESRRKMSESAKGRVPWNKGRRKGE